MGTAVEPSSAEGHNRAVSSALAWEGWPAWAGPYADVPSVNTGEGTGTTLCAASVELAAAARVFSAYTFASALVASAGASS